MILSIEDKLHVVFCVERGLLEAQARLLVNSAHRFLEKETYMLHAYSPRKNYQPSEATIDFLEQNRVQHHTECLNFAFLDYPIANKLLACAGFESQYSTVRNIMFVDTDTIFANAIEEHSDHGTSLLYLRPVDNKGPGSSGADDKNDVFWQQVYKLCQVPSQEPETWTTVRKSLIRPYFNAGLVWVANIPGFFQQWYKDFNTIVDSKLRPFGYHSRDGDDFRCLDQVALAVTSSRYLDQLVVLPEGYNYPLPFRPAIKHRDSHPNFNELVHIHYHKWFQHAGFLDHVTTVEDKESEVYKWLKERLPLQPEINESFKC